jgi:hypothetical protein
VKKECEFGAWLRGLSRFFNCYIVRSEILDIHVPRVSLLIWFWRWMREVNNWGSVQKLNHFSCCRHRDARRMRGQEAKDVLGLRGLQLAYEKRNTEEESLHKDLPG